MTFGQKLQMLRQRAGMSQDVLAERMGVSRQAVSRWERDETMPDPDKIVVLADLFGVTTDYLLRQDGGRTAAAQPRNNGGRSGTGRRESRGLHRPDGVSGQDQGVSAGLGTGSLGRAGSVGTAADGNGRTGYADDVVRGGRDEHGWFERVFPDPGALRRIEDRGGSADPALREAVCGQGKGGAGWVMFFLGILFHLSQFQSVRQRTHPERPAGVRGVFSPAAGPAGTGGGERRVF